MAEVKDPSTEHSARMEIIGAYKRLKDRANILALTAFIAVISSENEENRQDVQETVERFRDDFTQDEARRAVEVVQRIRDNDAPTAGPHMVKLCDETITFIRTHWMQEGGGQE